MFRRLGTALLCLAMFSIAGGHWAVLQSVAWAGMLRDYAREDGFAAAVEKTFSGNYPCAMCRQIAEKRAAEENHAPMIKSEKKAEPLIAQRTLTALFPPAAHRTLSIPAASPPQSVDFDPPRPVPRAS